MCVDRSKHSEYYTTLSMTRCRARGGGPTGLSVGTRRGRGVPAQEVTIRIVTSRSALHSTGMYAAPGQAVQVTVNVQGNLPADATDFTLARKSQPANLFKSRFYLRLY